MTTSDLLRETEEFLHAKIALSAAMRVRAVSYDGASLVLSAPLAENHNHLGTAFGGSLATLATLAGYAFLWLELRDRETHIVIRESHLSYLRPVHGELRAVCHRPREEVMEAFRRDFSRKGKARLRLGVTMDDGGERAVVFGGSFVALR